MGWGQGQDEITFRVDLFICQTKHNTGFNTFPDTITETPISGFLLTFKQGPELHSIQRHSTAHAEPGSQSVSYEHTATGFR